MSIHLVGCHGSALPVSVLLVLVSGCLHPGTAQDLGVQLEGGSVAGTVKNAESLAPISRAVVTLRSGDKSKDLTAVTNASGSYKLSSVPPGDYYLFARRNRFIPQQYGAHRTGGPGAKLTVASGSTLSGLDIYVRPQGVITGRVLTEDFDPVPRASVQCIQISYRDGRRSLRPVKGVTTNDLGEYRFYEVHPGDYYVSAYYSGGELLGLSAATTFHPDVLNEESAMSVRVTPGREVERVDISLISAAPAHISVRVSGLSAPEQASLQLRSRVAVMSPTKRAVRGDKPSVFEFVEIQPGAYVLLGEAMNGGRVYRAIMPLDVTGDDMGVVHLPFYREQQLVGVLESNGPLPKDVAHTKILLEPVSDLVRAISTSSIDPEGGFRVSGVMSGQCYFVQLISQCEGLYLSSFRFENDPESQDQLCIPNAPTLDTLVMKVSTSGGALSGAVHSPDGVPVPGVRVLLKGENAGRSTRNVRSNVTDYKGRYEFAGLAPGSYRISARVEGDGDSIDPAEYLNELDDATQVEILPSDHVSLNLEIASL